MNFLNKKTKIKIMSQLLLGATVTGLGVNLIDCKEMIITNALTTENFGEKISIKDTKKVMITKDCVISLKDNGNLVCMGTSKNNNDTLGVGDSNVKAGDILATNVKDVYTGSIGTYYVTFIIKNDNSVWVSHTNVDTFKEIVSPSNKVVTNIESNKSNRAAYITYSDGTCDNYNSDNKTIQTLNLQNIKSVKSGYSTAYLLTNNGEVYESKYPGTTFTKICDGADEIAAPIRYNTVMIRKTNGELYGMGENSSGMLGIGTTSSSQSLIKITDNVQHIYGGYENIEVLKNDGTVWTSTKNYNFTGLSSATTSLTKVSIPENEIVNNIKITTYISDSVTFFMCKSGNVYVSGVNGKGASGINSYDPLYIYAPVKLYLKDIKDIDTTVYTSLFQTKDGNIYFAGSACDSSNTNINSISIPYYTCDYNKSSGGYTYKAHIKPYNVSSFLSNMTVYTLSKINNNLETYGKYGSLSSVIYGDSKYDYNTYNNELPVAYTKAETVTLSTLSIDDSELKIKEIMPNGSMVTVDNYGSVQFYQTLTSTPVDIRTDGTTIKSVEYGMIDQTPVVMFYKTDGTVYYFEPTGTTISLKMLPIEQSEFKKTTPYLEKNAQIKYFLFEKNNGDLVYFDSNRFEQSVGINMNDVKAVIPSTSNNSTMYLMKDGTLKYLSGGTATNVTLPDGVSINSMLSNRYAVMSDGYISAIHNNAIVDTGVLASATKTACNNVLWMANGTMRQLNASGSLETLSNVNGKLVKAIVPFDNNNSYILNKDGSTYGVGNLISTTDLLDKNIDYNEIAGFISNNTNLNDAKLLVMKDGTVYENPINWKKSTTIYFDGEAINQIKTEFKVTFDMLEQATNAVQTAENKLTQDSYNYTKGLVDNLEDSSDKTALLSRLEVVQAKITKIAEATTAVVKAEGTKSQIDKDSAQVLVTALPECTQKTDLQNRLNAIVCEKSALEIATETVVKAEGSKSQTDIDFAQTLVTALPDNTDKTNLQARLDALKEEKLLADATQKVVTAETTTTQSDVDIAQTAINKLKDGQDKTNLQNRLDIVKNNITKANKIAEATTAVVKAEGSKAKVDIDAAQTLVTALPESTQKTDLQNRLNALNKQITDDELAKKLAETTKAVEDAEKTKTQEDVDKAQDLVTSLPDSDEKTNLQNRLDNIQDIINNKNNEDQIENNLLADATTKVVTAEDTKAQSDVDIAQTAIDKLKDGEDKTALQNRLNKVQEEIDNNKETQTESTLLADATTKVVKAEGTTTQSDVDIAQTAIDKLKDGEDKTNLQNRLDKVQEEINKNKETEIENNLLTDATAKVVTAEGTKTQSDVDVAQTAIDKLKDGEDKTNLQNRLDAVKNNITKIAEATTAVVKAEGTKAQVDIDTAQGLVTALPECTQKTELQNRLNALTKIVQDEKAQADLLVDATAKVATAEGTKTQSDVDIAQTAINKLNPSENKTALQIRLDKVKEEITTKSLIADATKKVEIAENTKSKVDVSTAQTAVNKLPQGDVRNNLQIRLDKIKEEIAQKEEKDAYNKLLDDAIKKVEKAESSKADYDIKTAQTAVNKLPQNEDRKSLQDRLDALRTQIEEDKAEAQSLRIATTKVELAEISVNRTNADSYFTNAQTEIDKLKDSEGKTALQQRLNTALEKYNNKKNANLINVAIQHVRLAEAYKNNKTLGAKYKTQAYETVNKLSNCQEKTDFLGRLDKLN